ncbi:unnamed protein product [Heligmosomoides polygyrus]|uniref:HARP domain-containing protein n=1 Tax=Heligmosomoides polygyrus TaxID=6339 RepID=A0A183FYA9_HELPZ|nr:unnamed protein product [Heligmosomoides polygyrus]
MSRPLTDEEKRRIAANKAEALRRAAERKKREALAAAAAAAAGTSGALPGQHPQNAAINVPVREFKPPTPAKLPRSCVHVTLSVLTKDRVKVRFTPYHVVVLDAIKSIPSRSYDANDRSWSIALSDVKTCQKVFNSLTVCLVF